MESMKKFLGVLPWWGVVLVAGLFFVLSYAAQFFQVGAVPGGVFGIVFRIAALAFLIGGVVALAREVAAGMKPAMPVAPPAPAPAEQPAPPPRVQKPSDPRRFMHPAMRAELDANEKAS